jgi:DNA-binding MarR family transcriptional regulator
MKNNTDRPEPQPFRSRCYCTNLRSAAHAVSEFYDEELRDTGLTIAQYRLLINLRRMGSANITEWSERVGLERSTMTRNIRLIESRGFIERAKGRGKTYKLTDTGEKALEAAAPMWEEAQKKIESFLGKADAEALLRIGRKFQEVRPTVGE